jgi:signal transduction histidine kinase/ActR/RegA family two-component response regulator
MAVLKPKADRGQMTDHAQSRHEIKRQLDLFWGERWGRIAVATGSLSLTAIYLPWWVTLACIVLDVCAEFIGLHYMRALDPKRHPARYRVVLACQFAVEVAYSLPATLIWHSDLPYCRAFAVGLAMAALMSMASTRSIHIPFGIAGLLGVALPVFIGNTVFWLPSGDYVGLLVSTLCMAAVIGYTLIVMLSNHRMHLASAADKSAALAAERAKSRFLAQMSHELRTPLNAILGMGHAELGRNKDALSQSRLSVLISAADGLSAILDDILDLSAIQAGRLPIRPTLATPGAEIAATLALFQPGIETARLALRSDIAPALSGQSLFDTQRLRQCLSNILSNALKHTVEGEIRVRARLLDADDGGAILEIMVADTGPGIPAARGDTVFEPFSGFWGQSATVETPGQNSNGLGLSICRAMARQMGGDLLLVTDPAKTLTKGANFVLTLALETPTDADTTADLPPADTEAEPETPKGPIAAGMQVLVVDDIATNRLVASTYLRMLGATSIEANSGDEAMSILATSRPDLVLLDMNMPGMSGLQTLALIRALSGVAKTIPVIAMTADTTEENQRLYLQSGMDGFLPKPLNPSRMEATIRKVLEKRKMEARSALPPLRGGFSLPNDAP